MCRPVLLYEVGEWFHGSPDGKTLASGAGDEVVKLWDVASGTNTATLRGHTYGVESVAFSLDGKTLASGDMFGTLKLWDVASGTNTATWRGHAAGLDSVAFCPDGKTLASTGIDRYTLKGQTTLVEATLRLWDVASRQNTATHKQIGTIRTVAFSPDGATLASGSEDGMIRLWNVPAAKQADK